jgi:hypothetical protein
MLHVVPLTGKFVYMELLHLPGQILLRAENKRSKIQAKLTHVVCSWLTDVFWKKKYEYPKVRTTNYIDSFPFHNI